MNNIYYVYYPIRIWNFVNIIVLDGDCGMMQRVYEIDLGDRKKRDKLRKQ